MATTTSESGFDITSLWDFSDPAGSELRFRDALLTATDESHRLELETQIARALGLRGRIGDGHATLDAIEEMAAGRAMVRLLLERGRLINTGGFPEGSVSCFLDAAQLAGELGETALQIDALHMLGIVAPNAERESWNLRAIALAESAEDPAAHQWVPSLVNNLGWIYHDDGRYHEALDLFRRALEWHCDHGTDASLRIARWSVARALRSLNHAAEALAVQQQLADEQADDEADGYVYEEIGECLLVLERVDEAAPWFAKAHAALAMDDWLRANEPGRIARLKTLGLVELIDQERDWAQ
jgi:tetratricopeptide (TPR) repeat protein